MRVLVKCVKGEPDILTEEAEDRMWNAHNKLSDSQLDRFLRASRVWFNDSDETFEFEDRNT